MPSNINLSPLGNAPPAIFLQSVPVAVQMLPSIAVAPPSLVRPNRESFVWTMAHEIRQPLSVLSTAVALIQQDAPTEATARALDLMARQIRQMSRMIEDLVDAARLANGKVSLHKQRIDLREVIREAAADVAPAVAERHHTFDVHCGTTPLFVHADAQRLHQVFSNLLRNAIKFTDPGGHIVLRVEVGQLTVTSRILDSGLGIGAAGLLRIFELFEQIQPAGPGLGIGLNVVREIVSLHSGLIEAHSDGLGKGSEFVVVLPRID